MAPLVKFLVGLIAVLLMGWIHHGPLGNGIALVETLEARARKVVAETELPGISVRLGRDPMTRLATLSGEADPFQREGQGDLKGLNDLVGEVEGISGVRWTDEPQRAAAPLLAESLTQISIAYFVGIILSWLLWGRRRSDIYS